MWKNPSSNASLNQLRSLCLSQVEFIPGPDSLSNELGQHLSSSAKVSLRSANVSKYMIPMEIACDVVSLCSNTLVKLKMDFAGVVGFSPGMVAAIGKSHNLKVLIVQGSNSRSAINDCNLLRQVLCATANLESLSIRSACLDNLTLLTGSLPKLRHLCLDYNSYQDNLFWMHWRMFDEVEIVITTYGGGSDYWRKALKQLRIRKVKKPRNFKYIIFTTWHGSRQKDDGLVKLCSLQGIKCFFTQQLLLEKLLAAGDWFGDEPGF
ncbi:uncharacterized protein MELLADRAFT_60783 [Melampsora larici-populina 98AG31]|uniref:F-box domain-containing protein n=1 Tax=Melampsora larici-populina (strain 98AG31 / pathotype 3-4-7) TaxID=747676 RepID=F4RC93_MELLP|nr:uncharacterized protein MELLADRAFT_60783 [Melampsora larici-populina 98AG31]EGG09700.1 hypothetical protein MELLADRAFT_60783 [Melampsora larici-populina 98AG31]